MNDPYFNLFDIAGIAAIGTVLAFIFSAFLGTAVPLVIFVVFLAACFFAKKGGK